jgi:hypothetical protein
MSNHDPYSDSPGPLLGLHHQVYPGVGADIVMESITLKTPQGEAPGGVVGDNAC